ncbi:MAG: hypothetical protein ACOYMA_12230 [Bacteroidia bacterium]
MTTLMGSQKQLSILVQNKIGINAFLNAINEIKIQFGLNFKDAFYFAGNLLEYTLYI